MVLARRPGSGQAARRGPRPARLRIRPADRREVNGDIAHIWPRGADGIGDHAFAIDLAGHGGSDGSKNPSEVHVAVRKTGYRGRLWVKIRELASMHAKTLACLLASLTVRPSLNRE